MVEIISVRFKEGGKQYYFTPNGERFRLGEGVIVETARGVEFGECTQENTAVDEMELTAPLRPVLRRATPEDQLTREKNKEKEARAFQICQEKIAEHGLEMKLEEAEYNLIRFPQRGVCLFKCGNERYLLEVHAPAYKEALFGTAGGR